MTTIIFLCCWIGMSPIGYLAFRWCIRAMGDHWTRADRLFTIIYSIFCGPVMPILAVFIYLLYRLQKSEWSGKDARW